MKRLIPLLAAVLLACAASGQEPDYSAWNAILQKYYDPARGMDYAALKARDMATVQNLRQQLGKVNVGAMNRKQQLAYWINVYNINTVGTILESYPVKSIRDISTDPIVRLNVFKKDRVPFGNAKISLDTVENKYIRDGFKDARIHFAINCAAKSCPPIRPEAFIGDRVDAQLDDQARRFLNGPLGVRYDRDGDELTLRVTKIMDWFGDDFEQWGGGKAAFIRRYVPADKQALIAQAKDVDFKYEDYDWALNDWRR